MSTADIVILSAVCLGAWLVWVGGLTVIEKWRKR